MVYISMLTETDKYLDLLSTMEKSDVLLLLYSSGNNQVPVELFKAFSETKGKVIFDEIKALKALNEEIAIAYRLGSLMAEYGGVTAISDSVLLNTLLNNSESPVKGNKKLTTKKSTNLTQKRNNTTKKLQKNEEKPESKVPRKRTRMTHNNTLEETAEIKDFSDSDIMPLPKDGERISSSIINDIVPQNKTKITHSRKKKTDIPSEGTFEYEIYRFESLCDRVKTKEFNPKNYMSSISKAVQDAIKDNVKLKDKTSLYFTSNIEKNVLDVFKNNEKELFDIVKKMHDLDK